MPQNEAALYEEFHLDEPWDSEHNKKLVARIPGVYQNPSLPAGEGKTNYLAVAGEGTAFAGPQATRLTDISDGMSHTILVGEADADLAVEWTMPADLKYEPAQPAAGLGKLRPRGFLALLADGTVRFFALPMADDVLRALVTRAGGEVIPVDVLR